jgi:hypothetical protein
MVVVTDESHNRMRIISPVAKVEDLTKIQLQRCMEANFHTAADVKYAISNGLVWTCYINPLKELSADQFKDGVKQVFLELILMELLIQVQI